MLPPTEHTGATGVRRNWAGSLILAPPSARGSIWMRRFSDASTAFVSGWMQIRGARRRRSIDRGFTISDHADWPNLLEAVRATGALRVLVTHGSTTTMVRWMREHGYDAAPLATPFEGEQDEAPDVAASDEESPASTTDIPVNGPEGAP
jgi:putative mRNA 3-end processing factor